MLAILTASVLVAQTLASPLSTSHIAQSRSGAQLPGLAPLLSSSTPDHHIPNSYIVVLKEDADLTTHAAFVQSAHDEHPLDSNGSGLNHVYDGNVKGYAGAFSEKTIEKIRALPEVEYIERDQKVWASDIEKGAPWGLARISHRKKLGFSTFREYVYATGGGDGVDAYVIDTGVNVNHVEFEGRARWGKTIPKDDYDEDANGHGTHCAGTIASRKYGVAKGANVIAVKVLGSNGSGSMSDVLAGVTWASTEAKKKLAAARAEFARTGRTNHKGSVANMSLGGGKSRALDDAVNRAVDGGLHFAVAAGNENKDACNTSPAGAEKAITVGASTLADSRAYFSNHGPCVDVFAPGMNILSTWTGGNSTTNTISGTSMASPHVAGLLAYLLSIYPSVTFDPLTGAPLVPSYSVESAVVKAASSSVYTTIHASLPAWVSSFLPTPQVSLGGDFAPVPPKILTPAELKAAILELATPGLLTDIPANTINLLIYNNATKEALH